MRKRDKKRKRNPPNPTTTWNSLLLRREKRGWGSREAENCEDHLAKGILGTQKRRPLPLPWQIKGGFMEEVMVTPVLKKRLYCWLGLCAMNGRGWGNPFPRRLCGKEPLGPWRTTDLLFPCPCYLPLWPPPLWTLTSIGPHELLLFLYRSFIGGEKEEDENESHLQHKGPQGQRAPHRLLVLRAHPVSVSVRQFHQHRALHLGSTPTRGRDRGDTRQRPYLRLQGWPCWPVYGVNTGAEGQWQGGGKKCIYSNINWFIQSFIDLFIQQVVATFLLQALCSVEKRAFVHLIPKHENPSLPLTSFTFTISCKNGKE